MTKYKFRIATGKDIKGIFRVMKDVGYIAAFYGDKSESEVTPLLLVQLFHPRANTTVLVCETESEGIIGYAMFDPYAMHKDLPDEKDNFAYNKGFAIHKDFAQKGLGTGILLEMEAVAKQQGYKGMYASIRKNNKSSIRVHEKLGYEIAAELPDKRVLFKKVF